MLFEIVDAQKDQGTQGDAAQSRFLLPALQRKSYSMEHPALIDSFTMSGADGDDAQRYQETAVRKILNKVREVQSE